MHGPSCYDRGTLGCAWPEQHDTAFTGILADPQSYDPQLYGRLIAHPTGAIADRVGTALALAAGAVSIAFAVMVFAAGLHFQTVLSNSMRPTVSAGDVAVTESVPVSSLRVGDVIAFYPPNDAAPRLHRITSIETAGDGTSITTRGDANPADDPWHATLQGTTAHRLVAVVPFIGWLTEFRGPALILAGFLVGLVVLRELTRRKVELADLTELSAH